MITFHKKSKTFDQYETVQSKQAKSRKFKKNEKSPMKQKDNVEHKKTKKDQFIKSKEDKSRSKSKIHKKRSDKNKLTNSPIAQSKTNQKKKSYSKSLSQSKSKSRSRSHSKVNTYRSNFETEKKKKKNDKQNKLKLSDKSQQRLKSIRLNTERDRSTTPLRQSKPNRLKTENSDNIKKKSKKKVNKKKLFGLVDEDKQKIQEKSTIKLKIKKDIPHIKTEYSERKASYFDESLLNKYEFNRHENRKIQVCPFTHLKSLEQKFVQNNTFQKQQIKIQSTVFESNLKIRELEQLRRQEQLKWKIMLLELKNLKYQERVPEKIDQIIKELDYNYISLQQRAFQFSNVSKNLEKMFNSTIQNQNPILKKITQVTVENDIKVLSNHSKSKELSHFKNSQSEQILLSFNLPNSVLKYQNLSQDFQKEIQKQKQDIEENQGQKQKQKLEKNSWKEEDIEKPIMQQPEEKTKVQINQINLGDFYDGIKDKKFDFFQQSKQKCELFSFQKIEKQEENNQQQLLQSYSLSDQNLLNQLNNISKIGSSNPLKASNSQNFTQFQKELEQIQNKKPTLTLNQINPSLNFRQKQGQNLEQQQILVNIESPTDKRENSKARIFYEIEQDLVLEFCTNIMASKYILNRFLSFYQEKLDQGQMKMNDQKSQIRKIESSNNYVLKIIEQLMNYIEQHLKSYFMKQIQKYFQCKPMDALRYLRASQDDSQLQQYLSQQSQSNSSIEISFPLFTQQHKQQFETTVLQNAYQVPNYFTFNNSIYDIFNEIIDELRPYGHKGKSLFSLELMHPIKSFEIARQVISTKISTIIHSTYLDEVGEFEDESDGDGIFQLKYFVAMSVIEQVLFLEVFQIGNVFDKIQI